MSDDSKPRPHPYYDAEMARRQRQEREATLLRAIKAAFGFGKAIIIQNDKSEPKPQP